MPQTFEAKALALCEMETECSAQPVFIGHTVLCPGGCNATGHVPLLDPKLVRKRCPQCELANCSKDSQCNCIDCELRGWVPSTDPWAYVIAAGKYWRSLVANAMQSVIVIRREAAIMEAAGTAVFTRQEDPGLAAFDVVWESLVGEEKP